MADQADDLGIPVKPVRPMTGVAVPPPRVPDLSRRASEPAHASVMPRQQTEPQPGSRNYEVDARTLIVGREISFSGDVASCDRLVVEGSIEANLQNCQNMIIADTGIFAG